MRKHRIGIVSASSPVVSLESPTRQHLEKRFNPLFLTAAGKPQTIAIAGAVPESAREAETSGHTIQEPVFRPRAARGWAQRMVLASGPYRSGVTPDQILCQAHPSVMLIDGIYPHHQVPLIV